MTIETPPQEKAKEHENSIKFRSIKLYFMHIQHYGKSES